MKKILLLTLIIVCSSAISRTPNALSPQEEADMTYTQFRECKQIPQGEARLKCLKKVSSENINGRLLQKISLWLEQVKLENKMIACPKDKLSLYPHTSNDKYKLIKCINFTLMKREKQGIIYFLDEAGLMKIDGIQFL